MTGDQVATAIVTAVLSGGVSAMSAVIALRVHVAWIKETLERRENALTRAHARIDELRGARDVR